MLDCTHTRTVDSRLMRVLGVVAFLIIAASTAHADDRSSAREHFVKGTKAFELGLYDEAIVDGGDDLAREWSWRAAQSARPAAKPHSSSAAGHLRSPLCPAAGSAPCGAIADSWASAGTRSYAFQSLRWTS